MDGNDIIAFSTLDSYTLVAPNDIICCLAEGAYTKIFSVGRQDGLLVAKGMSKLEAFLPEQQFVRVHHNAIVNIRHISKVMKGEKSCLLLSNGMNVAIANRRKKVLMNRLLIF